MMLNTPRLVLRSWTALDFDPFVKMNINPNVMRFFPSTLTPLQSVASARHLSDELAEKGWGMWVVEEKASHQFIGMVGLQQRSEKEGILNHPFVEIAWRLSDRFWGQGYAPEAAKRVIDYAFEHLDISSLYSLTALCNLPSQRVMEKIGMWDTDFTFQHPKVSTDSHLSWHCLYKITREG
ncbi:GNAT family N-acetyltransferase [Vibrio rarus]|uniref:GNAT family N-acetyltransferase n=1 Tax=Vibrio rarus TaxID=413403 RepID=UPI0021C36ADE|nr:GNAT family N-acetyltransferase [Vibrio rarus]